MELQQEQQNPKEEIDTYSIFTYGIRSPSTRDYYLRRLKFFSNHTEVLPERNIAERCNYFAEKGKENYQWAFNNIIKFLQYQKERVQKGEITSGTLKNFLKAIKSFCEMADISIMGYRQKTCYLKFIFAFIFSFYGFYSSSIFFTISRFT